MSTNRATAAGGGGAGPTGRNGGSGARGAARAGAAGAGAGRSRGGGGDGTWVPRGGGGPRGASTGAGRPRDIPERQGVKDPPRGAVAPVGLEAPGDVGRDVLSSSPAGLGRGQAPPGVEEGSGTSTPGAGGTWG